MSAALLLQHDAGLMMTNIQGVGSICDISESDIFRGDAAGLWSGTVPLGSSPGCVAVSTCTTGSLLHDGYGVVASDGWPGHSRASADLFL